MGIAGIDPFGTASPDRRRREKEGKITPPWPNYLVTPDLDPSMCVVCD